MAGWAGRQKRPNPGGSGGAKSRGTVLGVGKGSHAPRIAHRREMGDLVTQHRQHVTATTRPIPPTDQSRISGLSKHSYSSSIGIDAPLDMPDSKRAAALHDAVGVTQPEPPGRGYEDDGPMNAVALSGPGADYLS